MPARRKRPGEISARRDIAGQRPGGRDPREGFEEPPGFPHITRSVFTFEGQIQQLGAMAHGTHRLRGWRRAAVVVGAWMTLAAMFGGIGYSVLRMMFG